MLSQITPKQKTSFADVDKLKEQLESKEDRIHEWRQKIDDEQKQLERENEDHNDIFFVDVVDFYRNIPTKLLKYLSRSSDFLQKKKKEKKRKKNDPKRKQHRKERLFLKCVMHAIPPPPERGNNAR